jgi:hypothetical protein
MGETLQAVSIKSHFDTWLASKCGRKAKSTGERYAVAVADCPTTREGELIDTVTVVSTGTVGAGDVGAVE